MSRLGSDTTVTDTTVSESKIYYAGDVFNVGYTWKEGTKASSPAKNLTGYTFTAQATRASITGTALDTIIPEGNTVTTLVTTITSASDGQFNIAFPADVLKDAGYTSGTIPTAGNPVYIIVAITYQEPVGTENRQTRTLTEDVLGFRYKLGFSIT